MAQSIILCAFLQRHAELHGLPFPSGRGSLTEEIVRVLPSSTLYKDIYSVYCTEWNSISTGTIQMGLIDKKLHESLGFVQFRNVRRRHFQNLKSSSQGSDFVTIASLSHLLSL